MFLLACSTASRESSSDTDSAAVQSDSINATKNEGLPMDLPDPDTSRVGTLLEEQRQGATNDDARYYIVTVTTQQYEASSDVTWHFDKSLSPRYFSETWSMEAQEGTAELMIDGGKVVCVSKNESNMALAWCREAGGFKTTWDQDEGNPVREPVEASYESTSNQEFEQYLGTLKKILQEGAIAEESPDSYLIRIENTVDVGQQVTESTQVDIPKVIYKQLKD